MQLVKKILLALLVSSILFAIVRIIATQSDPVINEKFETVNNRSDTVPLQSILPNLELSPNEPFFKQEELSNEYVQNLQNSLGRIVYKSGEVHIPIGIPNTVDQLKSFLDSAGGISPGVASYGISFGVFDGKDLSMPSSSVDRGLNNGLLIPWISFSSSTSTVRVDFGQGELKEGGQVLGINVFVTNTEFKDYNYTVVLIITDVGPCGGHVQQVNWEKEQGNIIKINGNTGIVALNGNATIFSKGANVLARMGFTFNLTALTSRSLEFVVPIQPGKKVSGHHWDGGNEVTDLASVNAMDGVLQPDHGASFYSQLSLYSIFSNIVKYWTPYVGVYYNLHLPDDLWKDALISGTSHLALNINEKAPDVAVINYNVFNRDGMYIANAMQKAGQFSISAEIIEYFLQFPFNGRSYPEADNPGQVLWLIGEHWLFSKDKDWLETVYPSVAKLVQMIKYYRTTSPPHWVSMSGINFGDSVDPKFRQELIDGNCDGRHPEYTYAFDVAGIRKAVILAKAIGNTVDAGEWQELANTLFTRYDQQFGQQLRSAYGSFSVLWPCHLYDYSSGKGFDTFNTIGPQGVNSWKYFPLATAHQGLLAGSRSAATQTIINFLSDNQMYGWFVMDEGGPSAPGGWKLCNTMWNRKTAQPHGWAVAELVLLIRDSLVFEDEEYLVLFAGIPEDWFYNNITIIDLPTYFGTISIHYVVNNILKQATLDITMDTYPPKGIHLRWPKQKSASFYNSITNAALQRDADVVIPPNVTAIKIIL